MDDETANRIVVIARRCGVSSMLLAQLAAMEAADRVTIEYVDELPPFEDAERRAVSTVAAMHSAAGVYAFAAEAKIDKVAEVWRDRRSNRRSGVAKARRAAARRRR